MKSNEKAFIFGVFLFFVAVFLQAVVAFATDSKEVQITEVRKKLQMKASDPAVRDYYINGGSNLGIKEGALIRVYRTVPLADPNRQEAQEHVSLPVGVIKVIYADRLNAIGRIHSLSKVDVHPILESEMFMVGDRLDVGSLDFDKKEAAGDGSKEKGEDSSKETGKSEESDVKSESKAVKASRKSPPHNSNRESATQSQSDPAPASSGSTAQTNPPEMIIK